MDEVDYGTLPRDALAACFSYLDLSDFVSASLACRNWLAASSSCWPSMVGHRWCHSAAWPDSTDPHHWQHYYKQRHQLDQRVLQLLDRACYPQHQADVIHQILQQPEQDVLDILITTGTDYSPSALGRCYWARLTLMHLRAAQSAAALRQLIQAPGQSPDDDLLEVALHFVSVHHPLADKAAIRQLLAGLSQECLKRMAAAGVDTITPAGRRQALRILNGLLFGDPQPEQQPPVATAHPQASTAAAPAGPAPRTQQPSGPEAVELITAALQDDTAWMDLLDLFGVARPTRTVDPTAPRVWGPGPWGYWLQGPACDDIAIPEAPYGLGLKGDSQDYYNPANSLLNCVLAQRRGLPISLAVLHLVVGRGAGLPLRLVGYPGHVVNMLVEEGPPEPQVYIDVFEGGEFLDWSHFSAESGAGALQHLRPGQVAQRMLGNLSAAYSMQTGRHQWGGIWSLPLCLLSNLSATLEPRGPGAAVLAHAGYWYTVLAEAAMAELYAVMAAIIRDVDPMLAQHPMFNPQRAAPTVQPAPCLRQEHPQVLYRVGDVVTHKRYNYHGVIVGWDPVCQAGEQWQQHNQVHLLDHGADQPFYNVLVDIRDRPGCQSTYVAQENIVLKSQRPAAAGQGEQVAAAAAAADQPAAAASEGTGGGAAVGCSSTQAGPSSGGGGSSSSLRTGTGQPPLPEMVQGASRGTAGVRGLDCCSSCEQPVHHPQLGRYMRAWNPVGDLARQRGSSTGWYLPCSWLQDSYPGD